MINIYKTKGSGIMNMDVDYLIEISPISKCVKSSSVLPERARGLSTWRIVENIQHQGSVKGVVLNKFETVYLPEASVNFNICN